MTDIVKNATIKNWEFWVCVVVSMALGIIGFFMPPKGAIDGSVLTFIGELFAFATLGVVWHAMKKGIDAKVKHGNTELTIGDSNDE